MRRFLLWDHDGVLVDTERWYFVATREHLAACGVQLDQATYLRFMAEGRSCWDLATKNGVPDRKVAQAKTRRDQHYQELIRSEDIEIDRVVEVLAELGALYRMAIGSTSRQADFDLIHRTRRIRQFFEFVINIEDCGQPKPAPDPYLAALDRFGAEAADAIAIEDSSRGLASATAAGLPCVIVHNDFAEAQDFSGACCVLGSICKLPGRLTRMAADDVEPRRPGLG